MITSIFLLRRSFLRSTTPLFLTSHYHFARFNNPQHLRKPAEKEQTQIEKKPQTQNEGIKLKEASQHQEFYGLPLKKMAPQNEQDLLFKLSQKFNSAKDLLNFFESNRDVFTLSGTEAYKMIFSRLTSFKIQANATKNASKAASDIIIMEPQFKVLISDYNRHIGQEASKFKKFTNKNPLFENFLATLESILTLHSGKRFHAQQLPEYIRCTYLSMMNSDQFLQTLTPSQIATLFHINASPALFNLSIKGVTTFAHKLAELLCGDQPSAQANISQLTAKDLYKILYGFGNLHLVPHASLLYLLEPFVLAKLKDFQPDKLNQVAAYYIRLQCGSELFLKQLFAELSLRQDQASLTSQVALLNVLDVQTLSRKDFKLDLTLEVRHIVKQMMKKLNQLKAEPQLNVIVPRMLHYQIGTKAYYEMLAIEFVKHVEDFSFKNKTRLLYWFALADIDANYILKTSHKMCSAYSEAFLHKDALSDLPKLGLYSDQQLRYIEDASKDISHLKDLIVKAEVGGNKIESEEQAMQRYKDKIEHEEAQAVIKMVWSYMVFTNSPTTDKEFKRENVMLWEKLIDLVNKKLQVLPKNSKQYHLRSIDLDHLHQLNCFLSQELNMKRLIKIPADLHFDPQSLAKSSSHRHQEYLAFLQNVTAFFKANPAFSMPGPKDCFYDHYRIFALNEKQRQYVLFNQKQWYFEDSQSYNAHVRVRREHMKAARTAEVDFYEYIDFKKKNASRFAVEQEEQGQKEALFTFGNEEGNKDPVIAYLKEKLQIIQ